MPVGKSSIDRITKATATKPAEGIRNLAPEVPTGDAAKPATPKKSTKKSTPVATVKKAASASTTKATVTKIPTIEIGGELPYWLL
jgi:hypothetical protein